MSDQQNDTPANALAPANRAVTPPLTVAYPWPGVDDSSYEIIEVDLDDGTPIALCQCISPAGRGQCWWYEVGRLPGVTQEQRAALIALLIEPDVRLQGDLERALGRIRTLTREGHEPNLRRMLNWVGVLDGHEVFALQSLGETNFMALARSHDEALRLTRPHALVAINRWGKIEPFDFQGVYLVGNRLVGRIDEMFTPGSWAIMPKGLLTDERIVARRYFYLDLDTQRFDSDGNSVDLPISATKEELHRTVERALVILDEVLAALSAVGVDRPAEVVAFVMSGNGVQLWFALAGIPESPELRALIRELLAIWSALYNSDISHVDVKVFDAKRISPCAGTPKKKGVKRELHRLVTFDGAADPRRLTLVELRALLSRYRGLLTPEQRAAVGKLLNVRAERMPQPDRVGGLRACNEVPIREVATRLGIDAQKPVCPWCSSGGQKTDVAFLADRNLLNCKHTRCATRENKTCVDLVAKVAFGCDNVAGTKGVARKILGWFHTNFGVGGSS